MWPVELQRIFAFAFANANIRMFFAYSHSHSHSQKFDANMRISYMLIFLSKFLNFGMNRVNFGVIIDLIEAKYCADLNITNFWRLFRFQKHSLNFSQKVGIFRTKFFQNPQAKCKFWNEDIRIRIIFAFANIWGWIFAFAFANMWKMIFVATLQCCFPVFGEYQDFIIQYFQSKNNKTEKLLRLNISYFEIWKFLN